MPDPTQDAAAPDSGGSQPTKPDLEILEVLHRLQHIGRNEPCPCGSGRKYKKCCLPPDEVRARQSAREAEALKQRLRQPTPADRPPAAEVTATDDGSVIDVETESVADSAAAAGWSLPDGSGKYDDEPSLPPEVEEAIDAIWDEFEAIEHPSPEQMDTHLTHLLALPPEATAWNDLFLRFAGHEHDDLPGVFRRIAGGVEPTKGAALAYFYWSAVEQFVKRGQRQMIPEIVAGFCTLDRKTYDADALRFVELWTLAAGCEAEALALSEYFLPSLRKDRGLMPYASSATARLIFGLRVGTRLREAVAPGKEPAALAGELLQGIKREIDARHARRAADFICGAVPPIEVTRHDFEWPVEHDADEKAARADSLRRFEAMMQVAREAWQQEHCPPGAVLRGIALWVDAANEERRDWPKRRQAEPIDLIECLRPGGMERRIALGARDMLGTNIPHAHLLLEAHAALLRFAMRHHLVEPHLAAKSERNIAMLREQLGFPG